MYNLKTYDFVRVAHNADNPAIRGKLAMFLEYQQIPGDIRRAKILLNENETWLVSPSLLIEASQ